MVAASDPSQKSCFGGGQHLVQRLITSPSAKLSDCWLFSPKWDIYQGTFWKGRQEK
ncbi:rCG35341 [Rattus norvegicus]|uniref:RCG35341 n=1 Tax=Rattus norvegicus TaxID=10116 RepID=A6HEH0_RAT|nr:rCG35341 [Rattus norvegicus]